MTTANSLEHRDIADRLEAIVGSFNREFAAWTDRTGCVANLGWKYSPTKGLEILGIDQIIYRKPAPGGETLKEVLAKAEPK